MVDTQAITSSGEACHPKGGHASPPLQGGECTKTVFVQTFRGC